ncbi:filaggrin-2 [Anopheles moucheti]|uniref:filaggrin-2 n=1 Tax=Anopheles moucheti TaxID=186751 RepID=UPI0022F04472|nr:filaggrin-2 [Anopheles moucheti]
MIYINIMWKFSVALLLLTVHLTLASESTVTSAKLINEPQPQPTTSLASLYRSARDDYNSRRHCANCGPGYERDMRSYGRQTGVTGYYSGMGAIEDDRNWYYRPESFDDRYRGGAMQASYSGSYRQPPYMGYDYERYMQRPDDRGYGYGYPGMAMRTNYYDGGAGRMPYYPDMMRGYGYRGNGYDNLDPQYAYYMMQRGNPNGMQNRDRYYGSQGYYDDRMSYGGQYDQKNFRPWDQTYRGISGFDNSGRGYYFASRPLTSSSSSPLSSPSSSLSAHASYHVQSHPAPEPGYGGQTGGYDQHSSGHLSASYRPGAQQQYHQQQPQHHGSDRPDYEPSDSTSSCCKNRYPETSSNGYSHQGGSFSAHNTGRPSYGGGESAHRPSGSWNYVNSGTTSGSSDSNHGVNTGHVGVSINTHGSYGEHHNGPGQYPGGGTGSASAHEYGGNRGNDHRRESDSRQQSVAYGGRPRPASLGDTSYLMDRDDNHNNRVPTDQDSARPASAESDKRAKSDIEPFTSDQAMDKNGTDESVQMQTPKNTPDT